MQPDAELLARIVDRVVKTVRPLRIVLFGSAARGEMREGSDIDLLVVMPDGTHRNHTTMDIYRGLIGTGCATDVIVATESDLAKHGSNPWLIYHDALEQGRELYHASAT